MSKFDSCLTSLDLRASVPVDVLRTIASEYQASGETPAAAMLHAVEDQLQLAQMEEQDIQRIVAEQYAARGGKVKVPEVAPEPEAKAAPDPAPAPKPETAAATAQPYAPPQEFKNRVLDAAYASAPRIIERIEGNGMLAAKVKRSGIPIFVFEGRFGREQYKAALAEKKAAGLDGASKVYVYADSIVYSGAGIDPIRLDSLPGFGVDHSMRGDAATEPAPAAEPKPAPEEEAPAPILRDITKPDGREVDEDTGLPLNDDGTVTVYHHTSSANAERIRKTGMLKSAAEPDVYMTTHAETDTGYGDTAVPLKVDPRKLQLDDEFPDGRRDYRINTGKPGGSVRVEVDESIQQLRDIAKGRTIEVDGVRRPITDSRGRLVARDFDGQMAFWKFYKDGPVDAQGRPVTMFHGTQANFDTFHEGMIFVSPDPFFGAGSVDAMAEAAAEMDDLRTMPVYAAAQNPFDYQNSEHVAALGLDDATIARIVGGENWTTIEKDAVQAAIKKNGHDSFYVDENGIKNLALFKPEQIKSAVGNAGTFDPADPSILRDVADELPPLMAGTTDDAPKRVATLAKLKAAQRRIEAGEISATEYQVRVEQIIGALEDRNASKVPKPRERGADWVIERLMRARRTGELDPATVNFALWALDKNPQLAEDLGISLRTPGERGTAGMYNPMSRVMSLFKGAENEGTAVHEILHHSERMMPPAVQAQIVKAWRKAFARAHTKADEKTRGALNDMFIMASDKQAAERVLKAFSDGTLDYDTHYQLSNASEYWAVNATRIMAGRFEADSWIAKAKQWLAELAQKVRGWLGMESDAAVLKGLQAVLDGTGAQLSPRMLVEQAMVRDIAPEQTKTPAFKRWFGDSKVVNERGEPMPVYHGMAGQLESDAFDVGMSGKNFESVGRGKGFLFFTNDSGAHGFPTGTSAREYANNAASINGQDPSIVSAYLKIENPLRIDAAGWGSVVKAFDKQESDIRRWVKEGGHDGVIVEDTESSIDDSDTPERMYVVMDPTQIKSATGNSGAFDPADPSILRDITRPLPAATWTPPPMDRLDNVLHTLQDKFIDMKRVVQQIRTEAGVLEDKWDPYLQEELFHGRSATGFKTFLNDELRPLLDDMKMRGVSMDDLQTYLHNRHAEEANEQIARINPEMPDGGSGIETQDARDYLAALTPEKARAYTALAGRVDAITARTQALLVEYGLEKQSTIDTWNATYQHYVPLMREDMDAVQMGNGTGAGFSIRGSASQRRTGSSLAVVDILANVAMARERTVVRGEKNRLDLALYGLALKAPNPDFWKPVNPKKNPAGLAAELANLGLPSAMVSNYVDEPTEKKVVKVAGGAQPGQQAVPGMTTASHEQVVRQVNTMLRSSPNVIAVRVGGEDRFIFFNQRDERALRMAQSLKNIGIDTVEGFTAAIGMATRYFSAINTQYNPIFGIVNLTRDIGESAVNLTSTPIAGKQGAVLLETARLLGKAIKARGRLDNMTGTDAALWEEFQAQGGTTGFRAMFSTSEDRAREIARELDPDQWMESKWGKVFTAGGKLKVPYSVARKVAAPLFDWLSDYNEALENITRMSVYKVARDNGVTIQQSASIAKSITVNFNRKGAVTSQVGAWYAFFNAAVQGTTRMMQTLNGPAGKKIIAGGLSLGVIQAMMLAVAGFDDDEPPEFVKSRNFIIPLGWVSGKKNYITIPLPLGFNFLPNTGRLFTEYGVGGAKHTGKYITHLMDVFMDMSVPIGNAGLSLQTIMPTVVDPLAALAENRDFTGKPIYREDMNSMKPTPGFTRAKDSASVIGKTMAYYTNLWSGGTEYSPGVFSPTPDQIDYLLGQFTGGVGREAMKAQQSVSATVSGEDLPAHKIPLAGRFYGNSDEKSSVSTRFYANLKELNLHAAEVDGRLKDRKEVRTYLAEHPEAKLADLGQTVERELASLRKHKRELVEKGASKERVMEVEAKSRALMAKLNDKVAAVREKAAATP